MKRFPKYPRCAHSSGQARIVIAGKSYYLGTFNSDASWKYYKRLRELWQKSRMEGSAFNIEILGLTIQDLAEKYHDHITEYFTDSEGNVGSEVTYFPYAIKALLELHGEVLAADFSPKHLKEYQKHRAREVIRSTINKDTGRIKRMFKWAASEELIPVAVHQKLATVEGLRKGRCGVRDGEPVLPADPEDVFRTLPFLAEPVRSMVEFEMLTGLRPGEVCRLHIDEIDRSDVITVGEVTLWVYRPKHHKTEWKGHAKEIPVGPLAQKVLLPWLEIAQGYLFLGTNADKGHYRVSSYAQAVQRGCDRAKVKRWTPNQLRHLAAHRATHEFDLDAARALLGHQDAQITQRYAGRDMLRAAQVAAKLG